MTIREKIRKKALAPGDSFRIDWPEGSERPNGKHGTTLVYVYHIVRKPVGYPIRVIEVGSYEDAMFNGYAYELKSLKFAHNTPGNIVKAYFFEAIFKNKFAKHTLEIALKKNER
jgi:hypothetical protein